MADKDASGSVPWPALMALVLALGSASFYFHPLKSDRPAFAPTKAQSLGHEDVDARLWQDPFAAVQMAMAQPMEPSSDWVVHVKTNVPTSQATTAPLPGNAEFLADVATSAPQERHTLSQIQSEIAAELKTKKDDTDSEKPLLILPVMVQGDAYPEIAEQRLRTRVAVLQGLGIRGYKPVDTVHIGYFSMDWLSDRLETLKEDSLKLDLHSNKLSLIVPYEWCDSAGIPMAGAGKLAPQSAVYSKILVLWVNENVFYDFPLARLGSMLTQLLPDKIEDRRRADICMLGPHVSTTLRAMAKETLALPRDASGNSLLPFRGLRHVQMLSPWATASNEALTRGLALKKTSRSTLPTLEDLMKEVQGTSQEQFEFFRATHTDDQVCEELVEELKKRTSGTNWNDMPIALIGEWDTVYGRALPLTFAEKARDLSFADVIDRPDKITGIRPFVYLRGIDGQVASPPAEGGKTPASDSQKSSADRGILKLDAPAEQPEGTNQTDGLRRLADQLVDWDKELRHDGKRLSAVGILGTDLYDKLLVMSAVRDRLPQGVIFFSTDLDARYNLPSEWKTTHNLIIGSTFGLQLRFYFQGNIPPFRDSLQTAAFAATISAVDPKSLNPAKWNGKRLGRPRIFEIGRTAPFDMSVDNVDEDDDDIPYFSWVPSEGKPPVSAIPPFSVQSPRPDLTSSLGQSMKDHLTRPLAMVAILALLILIYRKRPRLTDLKTKFWQKLYKWLAQVAWAIWPIVKRVLGYTTLFLIITIPLIHWFILGRIEHSRLVGEEPFALAEGISIWPTEAIRLLAAALSVHFIFKSRMEVNHSNTQLCKDFNMNLEPPRPEFRQSARVFLNSFLNSFSGWKVYGVDGDKKARFSRPDQVPPHLSGPVKVYAKDLWREYIWRADFRFRFLRILPVALVYFGIGYGLMLMLGMPMVPVRGADAAAWDHAIGICSGFCSTMLNFFVLDATYLNKIFIDHLLKKDTHWNEGAHRKFERNHVQVEELTEFLDIRVIARRTEVVGKVIYYPFVIFFLMIVSRISLFDNWEWPVDLLIVLSANVGLSLLAAMLLRNSAENARDIALEKLNERKIAALCAGNEQTAGAFESLAREVRQEKGGAFSILSQYPWLAAILLPSGGLGLWVILEHLSQTFAGQ